jgi:F-type H+-transporting ATPase subunit b
MEISLGTFIFMAINFLLLLWILKKLLYRPIQGMLEERRHKISTDLSEAEKSRNNYETLSREAKDTLENARTEAFQIVERSRSEAEKVKEEILAQARLEVEQLRERNRDEIERAKKTAQNELREGTVVLALAATEKLLGEKMSKDINDALVRRAIEQIEKGAAGNVPGNF